MKRCIAVISVLVLLAVSCKKKEPFLEADLVLKKWVQAIRDLDYKAYRQCEAYPKEEVVFKEMYSDYYLADLMVTSVGEPDEDNVLNDINGVDCIQRKVVFECVEVSRKTGQPQKLVRGDVIFIHYLEGERKGDGWFLSNRTLVRINR